MGSPTRCGLRGVWSAVLLKHTDIRHRGWLVRRYEVLHDTRVLSVRRVVPRGHSAVRSQRRSERGECIQSYVNKTTSKKQSYRPATSFRLDRHHIIRANCPSGKPRSSFGSTRVGDSLAFMCVTLWSVARLRVLPAVRLCPIAPSLRPSTALLIRGARRHQRLDVNRLHLVRPPLARCRRVLPVAIIDC